MGTPQRPRVSVVIPTRGRPELLDDCLEALKRQTMPLDEFEVLVVDDGPDWATMEVVQNQLTEGLRARYLVPRSGHGPAAARNMGWRAADSEYIAFTDDDCRPAPTWLEAGVEALEQGADGVSGRVLIDVPANPSDYQLNASLLGESRFVTANCFYTLAALQAANGFDERYRLAWREDTDLYFTLLELGCRLDDAPDAVVSHPLRDVPWWVSLKQQKKVMYNGLLFRKHPNLYRGRLQKSPRSYYAVVLALLGVPVALATGRKRMATLLGFLWLVLTGSLAARRARGTGLTLRRGAELALTSAVIPPLSVFWRLAGLIRFGGLPF